MEKNKLYEFDVVKSMDGGGFTEIKTGCVVAVLDKERFNISIEDGELKIYKSSASYSSKIMVTPQSSNVITVK
jgi:hypothetical protein